MPRHVFAKERSALLHVPNMLPLLLRCLWPLSSFVLCKPKTLHVLSRCICPVHAEQVMQPYAGLLQRCNPFCSNAPDQPAAKLWWQEQSISWQLLLWFRLHVCRSLHSFCWPPLGRSAQSLALPVSCPGYAASIGSVQSLTLLPRCHVVNLRS